MGFSQYLLHYNKPTEVRFGLDMPLTLPYISSLLFFIVGLFGDTQSELLLA